MGPLADVDLDVPPAFFKKFGMQILITNYKMISSGDIFDENLRRGASPASDCPARLKDDVALRASVVACVYSLPPCTSREATDPA
jgi:hypothetical protein